MDLDIRRPLTPTGTNLLGLVKHQAGGELIYFGDVFGRPHGERLPWLEGGAGRNAGMWAAPDETRDFITGLYRRAWKHADATIVELPLDAPATVPWWGAATVTLCHILVHMTAETQRHAGHGAASHTTQAGLAARRGQGELVLSEPGVDHDRDRAQPERREEGPDEVDPVGQRQQNPVVGSYAVGREHPRRPRASRCTPRRMCTRRCPPGRRMSRTSRRARVGMPGWLTLVPACSPAVKVRLPSPRLSSLVCCQQAEVDFRI